jgi:hypothetical protein
MLRFWVQRRARLAKDRLARTDVARAARGRADAALAAANARADAAAGQLRAQVDAAQGLFERHRVLFTVGGTGACAAFLLLFFFLFFVFVFPVLRREDGLYSPLACGFRRSRVVGVGF